MTGADDDGWSAARIYTSGQLLEPRTFTEADPISSVLFTDYSDWDDGGVRDEGRHEPQWSTPTYVGKKRWLRANTAPPAPPAPPAPLPPPVGFPPPPTATPAQQPAQQQPPPQPPAVERLPSDPQALDEPVREAVDAEAVGTAGRTAAPESNRRLLAASRNMAVASLASRLTGFVRTILIVAALGVGDVGNAYNTANTLPNMVYELLLGGVLSSVLIPLLVHAQSEDEDDGVAYTQRLLSIATAALGAMTLLAVLAAPLIAGRFVDAGPQRDLTTTFATFLLTEIFFYGLGAMFTAVLNIRHVYGPGAWSPVLNNVIMMVTLVIFWVLPGPNTLNPSTITTPQIVVLGLGTAVGIAGQALVLVPYLRRTGFHWQWRFRARPNEAGRMREVGTLAGWVLAYVVASQVGISVIQRIGNSIHGYTVFTTADLLFQMPYGVLVVSLLTAIMPRMSRAAVRGDRDAVIADISLGSRLSAVALVPVTALLIVLAIPLAVTLFAHGQTSHDGAHLIGASLAWSSFGLVPFAIVMLQLRVFYAMRDGRTPALINVFMVGAKVILVLITSSLLASGHGDAAHRQAIEWLNISTSASYVVGAIVGHILLTRRIGRLGFRSVARTTVRIAVASAFGAIVAYLIVVAARHVLGGGHLGSAVGLVVGGAVGLALIAATAWRMRIPEVRDLARYARRG